jgi:hypothetical protein
MYYPLHVSITTYNDQVVIHEYMTPYIFVNDLLWLLNYVLTINISLLISYANSHILLQFCYKLDPTFFIFSFKGFYNFFLLETVS